MEVYIHKDEHVKALKFSCNNVKINYDDVSHENELCLI